MHVVNDEQLWAIAEPVLSARGITTAAAMKPMGAFILAGMRRAQAQGPRMAATGRGDQQQGPIRPLQGRQIEGAGGTMPKESGAQGPGASGGDGVAGRGPLGWGIFSPYRNLL